MTTRYIVCLTNNPDQIPAYLHSHSKIVEEQPAFGRRTSFLIEVASHADTVDHLTRYQASRLRSGMNGATVFFDLEDAGFYQRTLK